MNKKLYRLGARKEYQIVSTLRKRGFNIVNRMAGSHSPVDVVAIDSKDKRILLVQSKRTLGKTMDYIDPNQKKDIEEFNKDLNGTYIVSFVVM